MTMSDDNQCTYMNPDRCDAEGEFVITGHVALENEYGRLTAPARAPACSKHLVRVFRQICLTDGIGLVKELSHE